MTFRFFFFIFNEIQTLSPTDFFGPRLASFKKVPETDEFNINLEFNTAMLSMVTLNNVRKDLECIHDQYYQWAFAELLGQLRKGVQKRFILNLTLKHLLCFTLVGCLTREEYQLLRRPKRHPRV
jgi:hypothetical protein